MTLYFAYGSNMHRAVMREHAPGAVPLGIAALADHRFIITADGYASVEPMRRHVVYGVLWRIAAGDRVKLDAWENVAGGLYRAARLPVSQAGGRRLALVYIARPRREGAARRGYIELVIAAARDWHLPPAYIASLRRWAPPRPAGAGHKLGEFGWT